MATRTIVTCDQCSEEIKTDKVTWLSAKRWCSEGSPIESGCCIVVDELKLSVFCGEGCAMAAVRKILT